MKAIIAKNVDTVASIECSELPYPTLTYSSEAIIRVLALGLDGTDREIMEEHYGVPPEGQHDLVIGHESLGVVVEAGELSGLQKGDLVTALVRRPCKDSSCVNCRNGHADFCETGKYVERGIRGSHGFLCEYYKEEALYLVKVPKTCLKYGFLAEPQSIVEKVWDQVQRIQQRLIWQPKTAVILGSGPLGILAAMTCIVLGMNTYVWSKSPEDSLQANMIRKIGGHYSEAKSTVSLSQFAADIGQRIDIIMECTGHSPLVIEAVSALGPNGVLALLGVSPGRKHMDLAVDLFNQSLVLENKCVIGSVNASRKDFETGLYRLQQMEHRFPNEFYQLVTDRFTLDQVPQLDFHKIQIKAVVELVPPEQWLSMLNQTEDIAYSFSV